MPSTSKKQHNLMSAVAHNPAFAKKAGIPQSVGKEFINADKGRKFNEGGRMATKKMAMGGMSGRAMPAQANVGGASRGLDRAAAMSGRTFAKGGITTAKMGSVRSAAPSKDGIAAKGKTKGKQVSMQGGKPLGMKKGGKACY